MPEEKDNKQSETSDLPEDELKHDELESEDEELIKAFTEDDENVADQKDVEESGDTGNSDADTDDSPNIDRQSDAEAGEDASEEDLEAAGDFERPEWDKEEYAKLSKPKKVLFQVKKFFADPKKRRLTIAGASIFSVLLLVVVPFTRFGMLNAAGVRASATIKVLDQDTQTPLTNVIVRIGESETNTNLEGVAQFTSVRLGDQKLEINPEAYQPIEEMIRINMGDNQLGEKQLIANGDKYSFTIVDFLSGEPVAGAVVSFAEVGSSVDESGVSTVSVLQNKTGEVFTIEAEGFRSEEIGLDDAELNSEVRLVPAKKNYFVSKRSGSMDIYSIDVDGKNEELVLKGTGNEGTNSRLAVSDDGELIVWVTTRENIKNENGYILDQLNLISKDGELTAVDQSERVDIIGLNKDKLIYVKVAAGASGRNPERHRLISYNFSTDTSTEIAASNYFNDVSVTEEYVFYAPSNAYKESANSGLYRANLDGSNLVEVFDEEVWSVLREDVDTIGFDSRNKWYRTPVDPIAPVMSESKPSSYVSRIYFEGPDSRLAFVDFRDGKGYIIVVDQDSDEENVIARIAGAKPPIRWLSENHLLFRVNTSDETADYVVNIESGDYQKVVDVTDIRGIDRWYFYY